MPEYSEEKLSIIKKTLQKDLEVLEVASNSANVVGFVQECLESSSSEKDYQNVTESVEFLQRLYR